MVSITLSIPEGIKKMMEQFPEINWSGLVRKMLEEKVKQLAWKEEMLKHLHNELDFTQWTIETGRKVNTAIANKLKREGLI